jgi:hypothetical protein
MIGWFLMIQQLINYSKNKQNIDLLNRKYLTNIKLVGEPERKSFLNKLINGLKGKVPRRVVEYGLMGLNSIRHRTGANRNTFLLLTIGKRSLLTDDDIFCQISKNGNDKELTLTSDASFFDVSSEFFVDHGELNDTIKFEYNDLVNIHQKLLGNSISGLIEEYKGKINLNRIDPIFVLDNLTSEKRVRVTMMGVAGDSGAGSPVSKIFFPGNKLIPLISDSDNFLSKMYSRTVVQSFKSFTIGPPNFLLGMNLGIDNTEILPPFHPNLRNSDGIFASVLKKCFRNCYIGHLPFTVSHIPPEMRSVNSDDLTSTSIRIPDVIRFSIDEFSNKSTTVEEGLKSLGVYLRDISKRSDDELKKYFSVINTKFIITEINNLEYLYKQYKHINKQWAEFVQQRIEKLYRCLKIDSSIQFKDFIELSSESQLLLIRRIYANFGQLLYYWPEIYEHLASHKSELIKSTLSTS